MQRARHLPFGGEKGVNAICPVPRLSLTVIMMCLLLRIKSLSAFAFLALSIATGKSQTFTEVSHSSGIYHLYYSPIALGGGGAFFDYDNDGWLDIYMTGGFLPDRLYRNNGNGAFNETGHVSGIDQTDTSYSLGVVTGDINNDGFSDIFVTRMEKPIGMVPLITSILYRNNGNGTFTDITQSAGITGKARSMSASMGDYNLDGWLDIYVVNYVDTQRFLVVNGNHVGFSHTGFPNFLYKNNGNGTFTEVAQQVGVNDKGTGLATTFSDYDNDNDPDIFVVNDYGAWVVPNKLFRNEYPADSFTDISASSGFNAAIYGMGIAAGDYNEDGFFDYYATNIGDNLLHTGNGNGTFHENAVNAGVNNGHIGLLFTTSWGTTFFDYNNDTYLDLFVSNGHLNFPAFLANVDNDPNKLFENNGNSTFTDVSAPAGIDDSLLGRGCAAGDYDNDGDVDLLVINVVEDIASAEYALLFRNDQSGSNHWLKIKLKGTSSNADAIGSRVEAHVNGRTLIREIDGGSSMASQNSTIAHFGLGSYTVADSITVIWPGGARQTIRYITANQLVNITEGMPVRLFKDEYYEICSGDSLFAGGAFQKIQGTFYDTFLSIGGLDSVLISHLAVHPLPITQIHDELCHGDSLLFKGIFYKSDTILHDTLNSVFGCDSIAVLSLTFNQLPVTSSFTIICYGDSAYIGGYWQKAAGIYYDTVPETPCGRTIISSLEIISHATDTMIVIACPGDSIWAGGSFQFNEGYYADTFISSMSCDSTAVTALRFDTVSEIYDTSFMSYGDSVFAGGAWQTASGIYVDTFSARNGCDSIVHTLLLTDSSVNHATPLSGETYFEFFPNPATGSITINYHLPVSGASRLEIFTMSGKLIMSSGGNKNPGKHTEKVKIDDISPGICLIKLKTPLSLVLKKLIVY